MKRQCLTTLHVAAVVTVIAISGCEKKEPQAVAGWQPYANRYAIIVMSDGPNSDKYFWPVTSSMYDYLRAMGFSKKNIRFLAPARYAADHADVAFADASEMNIKRAYQWAGSMCTSDDLLYIFWISHGTDSDFTTAGKPVKHSTLAAWMRGITAKQIIGVYQPCLSGAVVDDISGRDIITTTSTDPVAGNNWPWAENIAFALAGPPHCDQWMNQNHEMEPAKFAADQDGDGQVSVTEAYIWVAKHRYTEGSMFDDNGDGVGGQWNSDTFDPNDPAKDGYIAAHYSLKAWKPLGSAPSARNELDVNRVTLQCKAYNEKCFCFYSFTKGVLTPPLDPDGVDLLYYFDADDCSRGALFGNDDRPGYIFPIGQKSWSELATLKRPAEDAESVAGIMPLTRDKEGLAFWVKTKGTEYILARIRTIHPASYSDIVSGETANLELEWIRPR